ncbi:MAG TPA: hypothetical protein DCL16_05990 [Acidimicrobiaceae bacterium]|nr:hypothetical protein [Acidimicrobiaceae bacterium]
MRAIVLAAGEGSRMLSAQPKSLHLVDGVPMTLRVLNSLDGIDLDVIVVVVGSQARLVSETLFQMSDNPIRLEFAEQTVRRGTADAARVGLEQFGLGDLSDLDFDVLVVPGDMPLLTRKTLSQLQEHHEESGAAATLLTAEFEDPSGYGRILRDEHGRIERVVEHVDAAPAELAIHEVNTSVYCFKSRLLAQALAEVESSNSQNEYYLTDVVEILSKSGQLVTGVVVGEPDEVRGVNTQEQLVECEILLRARTKMK